MAAFTFTAQRRRQRWRESSNAAQPKYHEFNPTHCFTQTIPKYPAQCSTVISVCVRVCVRVFIQVFQCFMGQLSQKSQGFKLFIKSNYACAKAFSLWLACVCVCVRVNLLIYEWQNQSQQAASYSSSTPLCILYLKC